MSEEQFSFVICGVHEGRWAGYAFDDTKSDEEDLEDKIYGGGLHVDPIASCRVDDVVDAECPIWDPREYFLNVVTRRVLSAVDSWEALLRAMERRIDHYVSLESPCIISTSNIGIVGDESDRGKVTLPLYPPPRETRMKLSRLSTGLGRLLKW